jgi:hypothetical protein
MKQSQEISSNVFWVGVKHADLKIFDELFPTHNGTTYNSYLVRGERKTALIDTVKAPFSDEFFAKVEETVGLDQIDLVVINHTEPDHSGALVRLLERRPDLPVYCTRPAQNFLSQLLNGPFNAHVVSDGEEVDLGGRTLRFILAPYLHWPDTMFTYLVFSPAMPLVPTIAPVSSLMTKSLTFHTISIFTSIASCALSRTRCVLLSAKSMLWRSRCFAPLTGRFVVLIPVP